MTTQNPKDPEGAGFPAAQRTQGQTPQPEPTQPPDSGEEMVQPGQQNGGEEKEHPHGGAPGQTGEHPEHPHGGPPGQAEEQPEPGPQPPDPEPTPDPQPEPQPEPKE